MRVIYPLKRDTFLNMWVNFEIVWHEKRDFPLRSTASSYIRGLSQSFSHLPCIISATHIWNSKEIWVRTLKLPSILILSFVPGQAVLKDLYSTGLQNDAKMYILLSFKCRQRRCLMALVLGWGGGYRVCKYRFGESIVNFGHLWMCF